MRSNRLVALILAVPSLLLSQDLPRPEIGIRSGLVRLSSGGVFGGTQPSTVIVIPDGVFGSGGGVHFTMFLSPRFALEPQFGLTRISSDGDTFTITTVGVQPQVFMAPDVTKAPYIFMALKMQQQKSSSPGFSNSESVTGLGLGFGFRRVYRESVALRYEARFLKWNGSGEDFTELALLFGFGAVIRRGEAPSR